MLGIKLLECYVGLGSHCLLTLNSTASHFLEWNAGLSSPLREMEQLARFTRYAGSKNDAHRDLISLIIPSSLREPHSTSPQFKFMAS